MRDAKRRNSLRFMTGRWIPRVDARLFDALLAAIAVAVGQADVWLGLDDGGEGRAIHAHQPVSAALSFIAMSMIVVRRRAPLAGLVAMVLAGIAQVVLLEPVAFFFGQFIPIVLMTYSVAAYPADPRVARAGLAVALAGVGTITLSIPELRGWDELLFDGAVLVVAWTVGNIAGARARRAEALASRAERLEREREHVVADERARLARELHDIVAHSVSVIAVQAEAGEALLDEPERAAEAFRSIQATSRQALGELRRLLGLLREVDDPPALAPQPGLTDVETLVNQMRGAGLDIDYVVQGEPARIDPGVDLAAYRVIQEALTNALKHAAPAHARVRVRFLAHALELEVADDGSGVNGNGNGNGQGLVGVRERVALYGGEVFAGRLPEGGFAVRARLPLESV
jgi:signal transduction histidine kinase